jgi:hypothetical protein
MDCASGVHIHAYIWNLLVRLAGRPSGHFESDPKVGIDWTGQRDANGRLNSARA